MASSTLVNVAEDAELRLVQLLADTAAPEMLSPTFVQDCENFLLNADAPGLMRTIINDAGAISALFLLEPLDEAVSAFSLLAALLTRVGADRPDEEAGLATSLAEAVLNASEIPGKTEEELASRRITLLSALYNLRPEGREKCGLLARMVRLAAAHHPDMLSEGQTLGNLLMEDPSSVSSSSSSPPPRLVSLLDGWDVPPADRRDIYRAAAEGIPDSPARKQRFTLLLVETYTDPSQVDEEGMAAAKEAAIGAIRDPITLFYQQRDMLSMPAIQALAKTPETERLYGLLTVFHEQMLQDYYAFVGKDEESLLATWNLSPKDCARHMRILSLCSLAAEHEEIPYATVAETLQLPSVDDVESWVIAALSSGLLAAKMDQLQQSVMVERSVVRRFDMEQWGALQSQLSVWKQNVRGILDAFKQSQQQQETMAGQQQPVEDM